MPGIKKGVMRFILTTDLQILLLEILFLLLGILYGGYFLWWLAKKYGWIHFEQGQNLSWTSQIVIVIVMLSGMVGILVVGVWLARVISTRAFQYHLTEFNLIYRSVRSQFESDFDGWLGNHEKEPES